MRMDDYNPGWMDDGLGIYGDQSDERLDFNKDWDVEARTFLDPKGDSMVGAGCSPGSPPDTGTWIFGAIDGVCQWIDTTICS